MPGAPRHSGKKRPNAPEHWAFLTRSGGEDQVLAELGPKAAAIGEGVVLSEGRPKDPHGTPIAPIFARQAMRTDGEAVALDLERIARSLAQQMRAATKPEEPWPWTLQIVAPDGRTHRAARKKWVAALDEGLAPVLDAALPRNLSDAYVDSEEDAERLAQVWVINDEQALVGFTSVPDALVRAPGGQVLDARDDTAPAPSARKIQEAFAWLNLSPGKGETVIDLGAAPGAWARVAADHGAKVFAVDRGKLKLDLPPKRVVPVHASPFDFAPEETADWLFVHLAWRPLEVAKLVGKWGRRVWARQFIANFLLPMKSKAEAVRDIMATLEAAGWRGLKARQLFHDGDEVTIFGWLDPRQAMRGPQAAFRPRSRSSREVTEARFEPEPSGRSRGRSSGARGRSASRGAGRFEARPSSRSTGRSGTRASGRSSGPRSPGRSGGPRPSARSSGPRSSGRSSGPRPGRPRGR